MTYSSVIARKKSLRREIELQRSQLTPNQVRKASQQVIFNLKTIRQFQKAKSLFIYISKDNEINTHGLINDLLKKEKTVIVPKIISKNKMIPVRIKSLKSLKRNYYGILEPDSLQEYDKKIDVCITPGIAFSKNLERLGLGRGFYDQYFSNNPRIFSIALAYNFQIVDKLPTTSNDQRVDVIVTQKEIIS